MGSWTALWLLRRGHEVVLLDAYGPGNSLSSSGGETRVTRSGYGSDAFYTRWQRHALGQWRLLEEATQQRLFVPTGLLWLATEAAGGKQNWLATLTASGVPVEHWTTRDVQTRLPWMASDDIVWAMYEPEGGVLMARRGVMAVADRLKSEGADIRRERGLPPSEMDGSSTILRRVRGANGSTLEADAFVFACGPWLPKMFAQVAPLISVTQQDVVFFAPPPGTQRFDVGSTPVWSDFEARIYGLPSIEGRGFKVAPDQPGAPIDPDRNDRRVSDNTLSEIRAYVRRRFPDLAERPVAESRVCQYESTPDAHFLIDRHPLWSNAWLVGGGSGHAFKHGPAIGEYVSALVVGDEAAARALGPPDARFRLPPHRLASAAS
jgi:glycine/D-amino acid oxidase-like deaminating enzyme